MAGQEPAASSEPAKISSNVYASRPRARLVRRREVILRCPTPDRQSLHQTPQFGRTPARRQLVGFQLPLTKHAREPSCRYSPCLRKPSVSEAASRVTGSRPSTLGTVPKYRGHNVCCLRVFRVEDLDGPGGRLTVAIGESVQHPGEIDTLIAEPRRVRVTYRRRGSASAPRGRRQDLGG